MGVCAKLCRCDRGRRRLAPGAGRLLVLERQLQVGAVELRVEEAGVEPVDTHVAVLTARGVRGAGGVDGDGVDGAKVTGQTRALLLKHLVPEARLEAALARRGGGDVHGVLTTADDDKRLGRVDGGRVQGRLGGVGLDDLERLGVDELGGLVPGGGGEVCAVCAHLEVRDHLARVGVGGVFLELGVDAALGLLVVVVVERHLAVLVAGDDVLVARRKRGDDGLGAREGDGARGLGRLLRPGGRIAVDAEDAQGAAMTHARLGDDEHLGAVLGEGDALGCGGELPDVEALAGCDLPETHLVVGGARDEEGGGGVYVDGPYGTVVALVGSEALAIVREPGVDDGVLCDREEQITLAVELDLGERTLVAREKDWPLQCQK
ncbi:hypothetical protein L1887_47882 [Cichorium endivia]|nr:hypothetical protein L1887_47882 [Cichorium endivia]